MRTARAVMRERVIATVVALATGCSYSCSYSWVQGPPQHTPLAPPDCTHSYAAPALDTALTIALATGSVAIATVATQWAGTGDATSSPDFLGHAGGEYLLAAGAAVLSAVAGVSAARGYSRVARCNAARDAQPAPGAAGVDPRASTPPGYGQ